MTDLSTECKIQRIFSYNASLSRDMISKAKSCLLSLSATPNLSWLHICLQQREALLEYCSSLPAINVIISNPEYPKSKPVVVFVGPCASGKSTLCGFLQNIGTRQSTFNETTDNVATKCITIENSLYFCGCEYEFIDTPSISGNARRDLTCVSQILSSVSEREISAVVLVLPFSFEFDGQMHQMLNFFSKAFSPLLARGQACVVLTSTRQEDYFSGVNKSAESKTLAVLEECNKVFYLDHTDHQSSSRGFSEIFCLNVLLAKHEMQIAQNILNGSPGTKQDEQWVYKCIQTRELMLKWFATNDPVKLRKCEFPLPPSCELLRSDTICKLKTSCDELEEALHKEKLDHQERARKEQSIASQLEKLSTRLAFIEQELFIKQSVQEEDRQFYSGEHSFFSPRINVTLKSASLQSTLGYVLHNCSLKPCPSHEEIVGTQFELTIIPDWIAIEQAVVGNQKLNWFAKVWLQYDGKDFFAREIALLNKEKETLIDDFSKLDAELEKVKQPFTKDCSTDLLEAHSVIDFLNHHTFSAEEFRNLSEAFSLPYPSSTHSLGEWLQRKKSQPSGYSKECSKPGIAHIQKQIGTLGSDPEKCRGKVTRVGFFVGNSIYQNYPTVAFAINDAKAMAETMSYSTGFGECVLGKDLTLSKFNEKFAAYVDLITRSQVSNVKSFFIHLPKAEFSFFFYAGHGFHYDKEKDNFLVMTDEMGSYDKCVALQRVVSTLEQITCLKTSVIAIDACRSTLSDVRKF